MLKPNWKPIGSNGADTYTWREMKVAGAMPLTGEPAPFGVLNVELTPPSINLLYHESDKTDLYKKWEDKFLALLDRCPQWHIVGDFRVRLSFNRQKTRADLDNITKPVIDMLATGLRIQGDHRLVEMRAQWSTIVRVTRIELWSATLQIGEERRA